MGLPAFLNVGGIKGPVNREPRQGQIPVIGYSHRIEAAIDPKSKKPTNDRRHGVLVIRKNVDFASPPLHEAHAKNTVLDPWQLDFVRTPRSGPEYNYLTVTLTKARVVTYRTVMPPLTHPHTANIHEYEEVGFAYESIAWMNKKGDGSEGQGFRGKTGTVVRPRFEPDWVEEQAKTAVLASLGLLADAAKAALMAEAKRKWEEGK